MQVETRPPPAVMPGLTRLPNEMLCLIMDAAYRAAFNDDADGVGVLGFFFTHTRARTLLLDWCRHTYRLLGGVPTDAHGERFLCAALSHCARWASASTLLVFGCDAGVAARNGFRVRNKLPDVMFMHVQAAIETTPQCVTKWVQSPSVGFTAKMLAIFSHPACLSFLPQGVVRALLRERYADTLVRMCRPVLPPGSEYVVHACYGTRTQWLRRVVPWNALVVAGQVAPDALFEQATQLYRPEWFCGPSSGGAVLEQVSRMWWAHPTWADVVEDLHGLLIGEHESMEFAGELVGGLSAAGEM